MIQLNAALLAKVNWVSYKRIIWEKARVVPACSEFLGEIFCSRLPLSPATFANFVPLGQVSILENLCLPTAKKFYFSMSAVTESRQLCHNWLNVWADLCWDLSVTESHFAGDQKHSESNFSLSFAPYYRPSVSFCWVSWIEVKQPWPWRHFAWHPPSYRQALWATLEAEFS